MISMTLGTCSFTFIIALQRYSKPLFQTVCYRGQRQNVLLRQMAENIPFI